MNTPIPPVVPVILSGGNATRLWPLSREGVPKQLLPLVGSTSLLQETVRRVDHPGFVPPILVCGEDHRFMVAEQLQAVGVTPEAIVLEPAPRNTGAAIGAAAVMVRDGRPDALMLVCPSDHHVTDTAAFHDAVARAAALAADGHLVTFGMAARTPESGYGYIRAGEPVAGHPGAARIGEFVEKPSPAVAEQLVESGDWTWNSGMFMLPPQLFLDELCRLAPEIAQPVLDAVTDSEHDLDFVRLGPAFERARSTPVDIAVMERTDKGAVISAEFGWDDVGSWSALWRLGDRDARGNSVVGDVVEIDSFGCYLRSDSALVATLGLKDTVVVATQDVVLVADRSHDQEVRDLVADLQEAGRPEATAHRGVHRPWGTSEAVDTGPGYQVNHLTVKPGGRLSLQIHHQRAEHWVVVSGTADVVRGDEALTLHERESIDVPVGCQHRLGNPGPAPLHLIEVQTGSYLGEDDIVRLEDAYGRTEAQPAVGISPA